MFTLFVLNLDETTNRVLSAGFMPCPPECAVFVDKLPEGKVSDYLFIDNEFVYDPVVHTEPEATEQSVRERFAELEGALDLLLSGATEDSDNV